MDFVYWRFTVLIFLFLLIFITIRYYALKRKKTRAKKKNMLYTEIQSLLNDYTELCKGLLTLFDFLFGNLETDSKGEIYILVDEQEQQKMIDNTEQLFQQLEQVDCQLKEKITSIICICPKALIIELTNFTMQENLRHITRKDIRKFLVNADCKIVVIKNLMGADSI